LLYAACVCASISFKLAQSVQTQGEVVFQYLEQLKIYVELKNI